MKPATIDFTLYQGSTFRKSFQWLSNNVPTDLTNCSIRMQVRQTPTSPEGFEFNSTNTLAITDALLGKFELIIPPSFSSVLIFSEYVYDIEITFNTDDVVRVIKGKIMLDKEVTK
jgi:hypothetical protein